MRRFPYRFVTEGLANEEEGQRLALGWRQRLAITDGSEVVNLLTMEDVTPFLVMRATTIEQVL